MRAVKKIDEWLGIKPKVPTAWQEDGERTATPHGRPAWAERAWTQSEHARDDRVRTALTLSSDA
eukprot:7380052-Prymnesium_polylepis.3